MTLLRHRGRAFADFAAAPSELEARLAEALRHRTGRRPSPAEARSWSGSLPILAQDLMDAGLDNVEVLLEHQLPLTSKRPDVILAGRHPHTGAPSYIVVELKQWSDASPYDLIGELVSVPGTLGGPRLHPVAQVQRYCDYLVDFTSTLHDEPDPVAGAAYLHNAAADVSDSVSAGTRSRSVGDSSPAPTGAGSSTSFDLDLIPAFRAPRTPTGSFGRQRRHHANSSLLWRKSLPTGSNLCSWTSRPSRSVW